MKNMAKEQNKKSIEKILEHLGAAIVEANKLQNKCDKYQNVLTEIGAGCAKPQYIANGALIGKESTTDAEKLHQAKQMLFRLTSLVNADQKPDEKFLTEIKTFLDA
jgi:hypothetical protein